MYCPQCERIFDSEHRFCPFDGSALTSERQRNPTGTPQTGKATRSHGMVLGGRYVLRGFIGKGAMARVYVADDLETTARVAIKVLDHPSLRSGRGRDRFEREATLALGINHKNVIRILDKGERHDGAPYLVMEYLPGESLGDWLKREQVMPPELAASVIAQAARGLASVHRTGAIHRDVKPDNLFLSSEDGAYHVKILDFGLARDQNPANRITQSQMVVGTMEYMAPEQVVADPVDPRTDVYGLGNVLYRTITGQLPFSAANDADLLALQLFCTPDPPSSKQNVPTELDAITLKAVRKRPTHRYETMDAFADDLERYMGTRTGDLIALKMFPNEADIYEPHSLHSRDAATFLKRRLELVSRLQRK